MGLKIGQIRTYRHYSSGQLDSAYVRISLKLRAHNKGWGPKPLLPTKLKQLEKLLVDIDYERSCRF
jgi:hypothetical protein